MTKETMMVYIGGNGYNVSKDLVDQAIASIRKSTMKDRTKDEWFEYLGKIKAVMLQQQSDIENNVDLNIANAELKNTQKELGIYAQRNKEMQEIITELRRQIQDLRTMIDLLKERR
jgi:hypothetical protein